MIGQDMGFLNIFDKLTKKELPQENYLSLTITPDRILALIWTFDNDELKPLGFGKKTFQNIDSLTHQAAVAIDQAGQKAKSDVAKTVFGLSSYWFEEDNLSDQTLKILKRLSSDLELDSEAFVSLASAASYFLKLEDSAAPKAILVGVFSQNPELAFCEVHLIENNKTLATNKFKGIVNPEKIRQLISRLKQEDKDLPSRIVVYGSNEDFVQKLQKLDWQGLFVHEPKIEFLDDEKVAKAVSATQARDILGHEPTSEENLAEKPKETEEKKADDFGFIEEDILLTESQNEHVSHEGNKDKKEIEETEENKNLEDKENKHDYAIAQDEQQNLIVPDITEEEPQPKVNKSSFISRIPSINSFKKITIALAIILALALLGSFALAQSLTSAEVLIKVNARNAESDFKLDVTTASNSKSASQISGQEIQGSAANSQKAVATGTKTIGEYAQGEITVLNWTKEPKNFQNGIIVITKNGLKFTLDADIEVASRSALTPGQNNVKVKAQEFGTSSNIDSGNDFTFQQYDELLYSAKNDQAITGGNEKQVTVVAQEDLAKLEKSLTDSVLEKARNNLREKVSAQKLHDSAEIVKIVKKDFDKKVDEEASLINLDMSIEVSAIIYTEEDLKKQLAATVNKDLSKDHEVRFEDISISEVKAVRNNNVLALSGRFQSRLIPRFNDEEMKDKISGKNTKETRAIIKTIPEVSDVQINFSPNLPFVDTIPRDKSKITFKVEAS